MKNTLHFPNNQESNFNYFEGNSLER